MEKHIHFKSSKGGEFFSKIKQRVGPKSRKYGNLFPLSITFWNHNRNFSYALKIIYLLAGEQIEIYYISNENPISNFLIAYSLKCQPSWKNSILGIETGSSE